MTFKDEKMTDLENRKTEHIDRQNEIDRLACHLERTSFFASLGCAFMIITAVIITWMYDAKFNLYDVSIGIIFRSIMVVIILSFWVLGIYLYGVRQESIKQKEILLKRAEEEGFLLSSTNLTVKNIFFSKYSWPADIPLEIFLALGILGDIGEYLIIKIPFNWMLNSVFILCIIMNLSIRFRFRTSVKQETDSKEAHSDKKSDG